MSARMSLAVVSPSSLRAVLALEAASYLVPFCASASSSFTSRAVSKPKSCSEGPHSSSSSVKTSPSFMNILGPVLSVRVVLGVSCLPSSFWTPAAGGAESFGLFSLEGCLGGGVSSSRRLFSGVAGWDACGLAW